MLEFKNRPNSQGLTFDFTLIEGNRWYRVYVKDPNPYTESKEVANFQLVEDAKAFVSMKQAQ